MSKSVVLKLDGDLEVQGFRAILEIKSDGQSRTIEKWGNLPPDPDLARSVSVWQQHYRKVIAPYRRLKLQQEDVCQENENPMAECQKSAKELRDRMAKWLDSDEFRPLDRRLREALSPDDDIQFLIRSDDRILQRLPWHSWEFFERYDRAEVALGAIEVDGDPSAIPMEKPPQPIVRILAILGHSQGIDLERDRAFLESLPQTQVKFLVEPTRKEISDRLWEQSWDILFFAGHSETENDTGRIYINPDESLSITELWYGLRKAVENGLRLAIFNSCDGLGLAKQLEDLHIPQTIVMREPVPDPVAQEFLKYFLDGFAKQGKSFARSVREARERLQGLEADYPCATWLPTICQVREVDTDTTSTEHFYYSQIFSSNKTFTEKSKLKLHSLKALGCLAGVLSVGLSAWSIGLPKISMFLNNQGFARYENNDLIQANKYYQLSLALNPNNRATLYNVAWLCEQVQDLECAIDNYRKSARLGLSAAFSNLGRIYILQGDYEEAITVLQKGSILLKRDPSFPVAYALHKNIGWARLEQGEYSEAQKHLDRAISIDKKRGEAYCLIAQTYERMEDLGKAASHWQNCSDYARPQTPEEDLWLQKAHHRLNQLE